VSVGAGAAARSGSRRRIGVHSIATPANRLPPVAWAYLAPAIVAAVAVQFWFRSGESLAGGDLAPPIAPNDDYLSHWNQLTTGAGSPGSTIVLLPYYAGLRFFQSAGVGEAGFQRLWLSLLFAGSAAAVVFLAQQLFRSPLAACVAGFAATFNAYHLSTGFDPVPLAATIAAAVLGGLVIRAGRPDAGSDPVVFAVASLLVGLVFANPPHVVLVIAWLVACVLLAWAAFGRAALARTGRFLLVAVPLALLFNLWWIVPAVLTVTGPLFHEQFAAAGVSQWAWTQSRNSITNVLSLTSFWSWLHPEYYPFAVGLQRPPFDVLQFTLAAAAAAGLAFAGRATWRVASTLAAIGLLAIWLLKGLHPPLGHVNLWLYDHVPGLWLFRDPAKIRLVLVLVFSLLAALAVREVARFSRPASAALALVIVGASIVYAYPLLTGSVVADKRPLLPSEHVAVPESWRRAAWYLNSVNAAGKVVVLPRLDYYQAPTTWGYYGSSFLHQLIHRPVIEPLPDSYYADPATALVDSLQQDILDRGGDVAGALQALGSRYVLLRRDLDTRFPDRSFVAPSMLARALAHVHGLRHVGSFGFVDLYEARDSAPPEVYAAAPLVTSLPAASLYRQVRVGTDAAYVQTSARPSLRGVATGEARTFVRTDPAAGVAVVRQTEHATAVRIATGHATSTLRFRTGGLPLRVFLGRKQLVVRRLGSATVPLQRAAAHLYRFPRTAPHVGVPFPAHVSRSLGDCNRFDNRTAREAGLRATVEEQAGRRTLMLAARSHAACVSLLLPHQRSLPFLLHLEYRAVTGAPARVCVWEEVPGRCATLPPLDTGPGWHRFRAVVTPPPDGGRLRLFMYADGGGDIETRTQYRALSLQRSQPLDAVAVAPVASLPNVSYRRLSPSEFRVHVAGARRPFLLVAGETYAPGWRLRVVGQPSRRATHLRVNGYANGWRVPWRGTYDLAVSYAPESTARFARRLDVVLIPLTLLGWLGWRRARAARPAGEPL
jgi:arabinofuranan 3-O-arabinosyltransferase